MSKVVARLWLCALFAAVLLGAWDVIAHAPALRWFEAIEIVAIYALLGGLAALAALPLAALALWLLTPMVGRGRAAAALLWVALTAVIVGAFDQGALGPVAALVALALVTLVAVRAGRLGAFEVNAYWKLRRGLAIGVLLLLAAGPPIGRRLAAPAAGQRPERGGGPPDVVLIVLDTLRADHLGAYGDRRGLTPTFDAFAEEGALYEHCTSPAPWTVPSHASLFTGLFPQSHGCSMEHHRWLDHDFTTLAEALAARDYDTAAFVANDYLFESNLLQGFATQEPVGTRGAALAIRPLLELLGAPARWIDHGAADAVDRVDAYLAGRRGDQPLFLFLNLLEAHWRHLPALAERLAQTRPDPGVLTATDVSRQFYGPLVMAGKRIDGPVAPSIRALYAAAVQYQDARLGELLTLLGRRLDLDRTVIAITADHGENLGEAGRFDHVFAVNDALLHVPLAIRYPAAFPPGTRVPGLCQLVDVAGTLYSLTNQARDPAFAVGLAGRTLEPALFVPREVVLAFGDPYLGHLDAMSAFTGFNRDVLPFTAVQRSISDGRRKLVRSTVRDEEFFDLAADRDEAHDLGPSEPEVRARLRERLDFELDHLPGYVGPPQRPPKDPDVGPIDHARLNQIGYVGADGSGPKQRR